MGTFAFQNTELINNLPKLSGRDIAVVEGKLGSPVEMQTCTSFPAGSDCAFRDSDGQWYWLTNDIIDKEIEYRLRHKHGLVHFGAYESIFKVDLIKAYDKSLYDHESDLEYSKIAHEESDNLVFLLGDTSQGPLTWPDWAEYIMCNPDNQSQWLPRTRSWLLTDAGISFFSKTEEDDYIQSLIADGWIVAL